MEDSIANKLIDISDPNLDGDTLISDIIDYLIILEGENKDQVLIEKEMKYNEFVGKDVEYTTEIIDDSKRNVVNKLFIGGEGDSNQTKYEQLLNNVKICTKSNNDVVGKVLLVLLRIIIDNRRYDGYIINVLEMMNEDANYLPYRTINGIIIPQDHYYLWEIVQYLSKTESFRFTHDIRDEIYVNRELSGYRFKTKIKRFIGDIDIWDVWRIAPEFGYYGPTDKYINIKD